MKCANKDDQEMSAAVDLDKALHSLNMLSTITEARRDYLSANMEARCLRSARCVLRVDPQYVSDVTVGYCMRRRLCPATRLFPYTRPVWSSPRHRTRSENSDSKDEPHANAEIEVEGSTGVKRCQSLETLGPEATAETHDLDGVSTRIERLQVQE